MTKLRRYSNAFALNQTIIDNEIKSSTPAPQKTQNTLGTREDRFGTEKAKKYCKFLAKQNSSTSGCLELKSKMSSSSAAGANSMDIITFFIKSTHDHCTRDSDGRHSTVETRAG